MVGWRGAVSDTFIAISSSKSPFRNIPVNSKQDVETALYDKPST